MILRQMPLRFPGAAFALVAVGAILLSVACAQSGASAAPTAPLVDDAGRTVAVKGIPTKIVSLSPSNTEILFALGLGDRVVGVTDFCDYPPEARNKAKVGGFAEVDAERVASLSPDLILASNIHVARVVPSLEKLGLTVVVIDPKTAADVTGRLATVGKLTGKEKEALELKAKLDGRIASTTEKAKSAGQAPRVFWMLGDGLFTAGPGSYVDDLIQKAGGANIAASAKTSWPELSLEAVVQADPEVIVIPGAQGPAIAEKLKNDRAWQQVSAVKSGRFVLIPDENVVLRPGPRIADGLDQLARGLHPDRVK